MKITDIWRTKEKPTLSFELFPARSEKAAEKLEGELAALAALEPDFVSVTFGAGGSTRDGSRQLVQKLIEEKCLNVIAYFACYGLGPDDIFSILDKYIDLGVENFLAVRGDPPSEEGFVPHSESRPHASDLLALIRPRYNTCIGVAGYPEKHIESSSTESDLEYLKLKVGLGAQYIITNYFYDNQFFFDFLDRCRCAGIEIPIIPGIMPIYSVKMMETLAAICGATISDEIRQEIAALPEGEKDALESFGIDFAIRQCGELLKYGVPGLHLYTMNRSRSAIGIVNGLRSAGLL